MIHPNIVNHGTLWAQLPHVHAEVSLPLLYRELLLVGD